MNNILGAPVKNIFSRGALAVLNACAKFAYNLAFGFGIKLLKSNGSAVISIDTESGPLQNWIKDQSHEYEPSEETEELKSGYETIGDNSSLATSNAVKWKKGTKDAELFVLCRQTDGGTEGALFFRKIKIDRLGHVVLIDAEDTNYGWAITAVP